MELLQYGPKAYKGIKSLMDKKNTGIPAVTSNATPMPVMQSTSQRTAPQSTNMTAPSATPVNTPPVGVGSKKIFSGGTTSVQNTAPTSTTAPGAPAAAPVMPKQWINPKTGGFYSPEEIAANIATSAPASRGDVPKLAGDALTQGPQTAEQIQREAAGINNARNDIAVGETDPYNVGSQSGIAYTPAELAAIEKSYAGIYDPAIDSAFAKLDRKQKEDADARKLESDMKLKEVDQKNKLSEMAEKFKYDLRLKKTPDGNTVASNSAVLGGSTSSGGYVKGANPLVDDYVNRVNTGQITEDDLVTKYLPGVKNTAMRAAVLQGLNATRYDNAKTAGDLDTINTIGKLLANPKLKNISGVLDQFVGGIFGEAATAKNEYNQLRGALELGASGKLKGQGQISNYERDILKNAASALGRNLNDEEFRKQLIKFQGATKTASGLETSVRITDPKTHESMIVLANTAGIADAIKDGMAVEYVADDTQ